MLVTDIAVVMMDIVVVGSDIEWDPALDYSLVDLSRKNLDDSSTMDYKCLGKDCSTSEI